MKQILIVAVAIAAMAGMQSTADAVLVKVLIDDFDVPPAGPFQTSTVGGNTVGPPLSAGGIATTRTLDGRAAAGLTPAALTAGNGFLSIALAAGETASMTVTIDPASQDFAVLNPHFVLTALTAAAGVSPTASLLVTVIDDLGFYDSKTFVAGNGPQHLGFFNSIPANPTTFLTFVFEADPNGTGEDFSGTTESLIANPEPATMALIGLGVLGGAFGYRRRRKDDEVVPTSAA